MMEKYEQRGFKFMIDVLADKNQGLYPVKFPYANRIAYSDGHTFFVTDTAVINCKEAQKSPVNEKYIEDDKCLYTDFVEVTGVHFAGKHEYYLFEGNGHTVKVVTKNFKKVFGDPFKSKYRFKAEKDKAFPLLLVYNEGRLIGGNTQLVKNNEG